MESISPTQPAAPAPPPQPRRRRHRTRRREPQVDKRQLAVLAAAFVLLVFLVFNRAAKEAVRTFVARFLPSLQGIIRAEILALVLVGLTVVYLVVPQADTKILQFLGVGRRRRRRV